MLTGDPGQNFPGSPQFVPRSTFAEVIHSPPSVSRLPIARRPISWLPISCTPISWLPVHNHIKAYRCRSRFCLSFLRNCSANDNRWEHCRRLRDYGHLLVLANHASHPCWRAFFRMRSEKCTSHPCRRAYFRMRSENPESHPCRRVFFRTRSEKCAGHPCWRAFLRMRSENPESHPCQRVFFRMRSEK